MLPLLLPLLWAGSLVHSRRYLVRMPQSLTVQEGLCAFVPCSIVYPWQWSDSGHGYWYREGATSGQDAPVATNNRDREVQEETRGRFLLLGDPRMQNCSLDIRDARRTDEGLYHFQGEREYHVFYPHQWNKLFLSVTAALNHTPDILIPGSLVCGRPTNLTCSVPWACERGTPPIFSWMSAAHTSLGPWTHNLSSVLTLTPRPQDHGTNLTCQVQFPAVVVTVERTIQLNVTCALQSPAINVSLGDSPGKSGSGPGVVLVAIVVAASKTLFLFLCLVILIVRYHRRKLTRPTRVMRDANTESS